MHPGPRLTAMRNGVANQLFQELDQTVRIGSDARQGIVGDLRPIFAKELFKPGQRTANQDIHSDGLNRQLRSFKRNRISRQAVDQ